MPQKVGGAGEGGEVVVERALTPCSGVRAVEDVGFPAPFPSHYPWEAHSHSAAARKLPFSVLLASSPSEPRFIAATCQRVCDEGQPACSSCNSLIQHCPPLTALKQQALQDATKAASSTLSHSNLTPSQLAARSDMHKASHDELRLKVYTCERKLSSMGDRLRDAGRLVVAISPNSVTRVHQVLAVQVKRGSSYDAKLAKLCDAVEGKYKAKVRCGCMVGMGLRGSWGWGVWECMWCMPDCVGLLTTCMLNYTDVC